MIWGFMGHFGLAFCSYDIINYMFTGGTLFGVLRQLSDLENWQNKAWALLQKLLITDEKYWDKMSPDIILKKLF